MDLRTYLRQQEIQPATFAPAIGVTVQALYRYLSGERFPGPAILLRIRRATNGAVTADDFVDQHTQASGPGDPTPAKAA